MLCQTRSSPFYHPLGTIKAPGVHLHQQFKIFKRLDPNVTVEHVPPELTINPHSVRSQSAKDGQPPGPRRQHGVSHINRHLLQFSDMFVLARDQGQSAEDQRWGLGLGNEVDVDVGSAGMINCR